VGRRAASLWDAGKRGGLWGNRCNVGPFLPATHRFRPDLAGSVGGGGLGLFLAETLGRPQDAARLHGVAVEVFKVGLVCHHVLRQHAELNELVAPPVHVAVRQDCCHLAVAPPLRLPFGQAGRIGRQLDVAVEAGVDARLQVALLDRVLVAPLGLGTSP